MLDACPFCALLNTQALPGPALAAYFRDGYPVSPGHTLVVPRRHVACYADASPAEREALWQLVDIVREMLSAEGAPDGFNIGLNDGPAAGQTVPHLHIHVIPRFAGDMTDPRGGVRYVIPDKAKYWA